MMENIIVIICCVAAVAAGIWAYWVDHTGDDIVETKEEDFSADKKG